MQRGIAVWICNITILPQVSILDWHQTRGACIHHTTHRPPRPSSKPPHKQTNILPKLQKKNGGLQLPQNNGISQIGQWSSTESQIMRYYTKKVGISCHCNTRATNYNTPVAVKYLTHIQIMTLISISIEGTIHEERKFSPPECSKRPFTDDEWGVQTLTYSFKYLQIQMWFFFFRFFFTQELQILLWNLWYIWK